MSQEGFGHVEIPRWRLQGSLGTGQDVDEEKGKDLLPRKIVRLLFAKLADFLIPGAQIASMATAGKLGHAEGRTEPDKRKVVLNEDGDSGTAEETVLPQGLPDMDRMLSLFIHKREDQTANEVVQQLLNASSDMHLFQPSAALAGMAGSGSSQNLDKIVNIDKELTKSNKAEIVSDDATIILRRAVKLAQQGFVVSIGTPQRLDELSEEKRIAVEQVARERNVHLAKFDPARPFISSNVANSMAYELIELIHSLFSASTASTWEAAIHGIIGQGLASLRDINEANEMLFTGSSCELFSIYSQGRQILAVLAALGAYEVSVKPGVQVRITGPDMDDCQATVVSLSETTGLAVVNLCIPPDVSHFPRPANQLQVPLSRLEVIHKSDPVQLFLSLSDEIIECLQSLLIPDPTGTDPLSMALPGQGEGRSLKLATARLVAEIRTRALQVLALFLQEPEFACRFMQHSCQAVDMLKCLSKDCLPSDRQTVIDSATTRLRNLYRDCVKPPAPPSRRTGARHKVMVWDPSKTFPPLKAVLFTHNMLGITYYSEPSVGSVTPRGILVYSNQMIPPSVNNFYWEVDILSLGDSPDESGAPLISIGLAPLAEKKENAWSNPIGTVFFHNNGRVVHYNGSSLLQWRSLRFDVQLNPGDTLGIGWEKLFDASGNIPSSGTVFFTLNGIKLDQALEEVSGNMYPVIHIQKKNTRVKANFGSSKFAYSNGPVLQAVAVLNDQPEEHDVSDGFGSMPFQSDSDSSGSNSPDTGYAVGAGHRRVNTYSCRTALTPKALREYVVGASEEYRTGLSNDIGARTGPHIQPVTSLDDDSDSDEDEDDVDFEEEIEHREDVNSLLVKAWETKVFPIIRRRFRNEAERKDGLEQIKGALSLGMADIARQTVEFLYEENGGIPRDLHLPTLDDVKAEMSKFTIDKLKRGQQVLIVGKEDPPPKYCIPSMVKTFGLVGEVLEIDSTNELVQVETYLRSEGLLIRFWYPITVLEKPNDCTMKLAVTGAQVVNVNSSQVHKELMSWEFASTRFYCRKAYIQLIEQSREAELPTYNLAQDNSSMKAMISSNILLLRDIDLENLQQLSNHLLATPANGNMLECNLNIAEQQHVLNLEKAKLSTLFYHECSSLQFELGEFIKKAARKGEDYVIELTNQICLALQLAPEFFCTEEILISDISTLKSCIQFPGTAFVISSVRAGKNMQEIKDLKDLTIQLQTVDGCYVRFNGQISSKDIVQYPIEARGFKDPLYSAFKPVIMATDKVKVSHSGGEDLGIRLYLHGIPQQLPLAVLYLEEILEVSFSEDDSKLITKGIVHQVLEVLSGLLMHYDMPQVVKEKMFLLLAEFLKHYDEKVKQSKQEIHLPHLQIFAQIHGELKTLYDYETTRKLFGRFSSYLQALFEVCLAITDLTGMQMTSSIKKSRSPTPASSSDKESSPVPTSARRRFRPSGRRTRTPSASSHTSQTEQHIAPSNVLQDKYWFSKANLLVHTMKFMVERNQSIIGQAHDFFRDCYLNQSSPNDYARLLVLKGIPKHLNERQIVSTVHKILGSFGGLFKGDIFLPPILKDDESNLDDSKREKAEDSATSGRKRTISFVEPVRPNNSGLAVLQLRSMHKLDAVKAELEKSQILSQPGEMDIADEFGVPGGLCIHKVSSSFHVEDILMESSLELYLKNKLFSQNCLRPEALNALEDLFISCYIASQHCSEMEESDSSMESGITLKQSDILLQDDGNLLYTFFFGIKQTRRGLIEGVKEIFQQYGTTLQQETFYKENNPDQEPQASGTVETITQKNEEISIVDRVMQASKESLEHHERKDPVSSSILQKSVVTHPVEEEEMYLTLEGFLKFIDEYALQNIRAVWTGLRSCGFDLQLERIYPMDWIQQQNLSSSWTLEMDEALVGLGNGMGRQFQISPLLIQPGEIYLAESDEASPEFQKLQGLAPENIRSRYAALVHLNAGLSTDLLALVDFRSADEYPGSTGAIISKAGSYAILNVQNLFDLKSQFLRVISTCMEIKYK
jgi:E3 ubiquitin-protein ligase HECTD4